MVINWTFLLNFSLFIKFNIKNFKERKIIVKLENSTNFSSPSSSLEKHRAFEFEFGTTLLCKIPLKLEHFNKNYLLLL